MGRRTLPDGCIVDGYLAYDIPYLGRRLNNKMQANKLCTALIGAFQLTALAQTHAHTQFVPQVYKVSGVTADDVLNVRSAPDSQSQDVGDLQAEAGPLEVLSLDETGKWGRLNWLEGDGWVSMRYLEPIKLETLGNTSLPVGLQCSGTEPFWSMSVESVKSLQLSLQPDSDMIAAINSVASSINNIEYPVAIAADADEVQITAIVRPLACSDGMSDRSYGWEVDVLTRTGKNSVLLSGCCSLTK